MEKRVYFIEMLGHYLVKIGASSFPMNRRGSLQSWSPFELRLIAEFPGYKFAESVIHDRFRHVRLKNEWFHLTAEIQEFIDQAISLGRLPIEGLPEQDFTSVVMAGAAMLLKRAGKTQADFAKFMGLHPSTISNWYCAENIPSKHAPALMRFLREEGLDLEYEQLFKPLLRQAA